VPARGTRPTTDRVRESLFNVLAAQLDFTGLEVLDLYAGSGALGLEALSRGAGSAILVESDHRAAAMITRNVAALGLAGAIVRRAPVTTVLTAGTATAADLVFADPPYDVGNPEVQAVLTLLAEKGWATTGTVAVIERPASGPELKWPSGWEPVQQRRYGDTRLELAEYSR
jgi:16S rRNA (guanine966-N2)-methyltransferase